MIEVQPPIWGVALPSCLRPRWARWATRDRRASSAPRRGRDLRPAIDPYTCPSGTQTERQNHEGLPPLSLGRSYRRNIVLAQFCAGTRYPRRRQYERIRRETKAFSSFCRGLRGRSYCPESSSPAVSGSRPGRAHICGPICSERSTIRAGCCATSTERSALARQLCIPDCIADARAIRA